MPRTLIFIVAYNAERLIESVLSRIPTALYDYPDIEVLLIDGSVLQMGTLHRGVPICKITQP